MLFEMGDEASVRDVETTAYQADRDEGSGLLDLRKYSNAESMKAALKKKRKMATTLPLLSSSLPVMETCIL